MTREELNIIIAKAKVVKPNLESDGYADGSPVYDTWECPNCGSTFEFEYDRYNYCPDCGQKIDWSDIDDEFRTL